MVVVAEAAATMVVVVVAELGCLAILEINSSASIAPNPGRVISLLTRESVSWLTGLDLTSVSMNLDSPVVDPESPAWRLCTKPVTRMKYKT